LVDRDYSCIHFHNDSPDRIGPADIAFLLTPEYADVECRSLVNQGESQPVAKKAIDPQTDAINALTLTLADPSPKVLFGTAAMPGFFKGSSQAVKAAARLCEERQWLVATGEWVGKGANKKQKYRLTPAGIKAILENSSTTVLIQGLTTAVQQQANVLTSLRDQLGTMTGLLQPFTEAVAHLSHKIEPPDLEKILQKITSEPSSAPATPASSANWLDDVLKMVTEQRQRDRYQPLALPDVFARLQQARPTITLGQFHDGLRALRDQGRIRLVPFTRALATIDDPRNALFLDGEVMYYVELP
jgi:hypothetical protein